MSYEDRLLEEELKNKVAKDWFGSYDCTKIIGKIDFCVAKSRGDSQGKQSDMFDETVITQSLLWAESKKGHNQDIYESFVQLILTIGRAKTIEKYLPPVYLGAFDAQKIAFIPYNIIAGIFAQNDFDWTVTPSNHETKEFRQLYNLVKGELEKKSLLFEYDRDEKELRKFIKSNFVSGKDGAAITVTKNNFVAIYLKWLKAVKPTISIDWEKAKKLGIIDADFYLADLLSKDNESIKDSLFVLLKHTQYLMYRKDKDELGLQDATQVMFNDGQTAHKRFWRIYSRPPRKDFCDYIVKRRDLLVPQDVRERKGSFFTPQKWVELSQKYLAEVLGENWQDEYYIWDCCAGTGNLLSGLTNKYRIWASTLDKADVDVMKDRIKNGANLLETHVFQMDFLNDSFAEKCPADLLEILNNPAKRRKLVIYINPPYAECGLSSEGKNKSGVALGNATYCKYVNFLGRASRELFAQFFIRIYKEIPDCLLGEFSTLKILQAGNFAVFRQVFQAKLEKMFVVPADTFDNVKGQFPIGFLIWDTAKKEIFKRISADVYNREGEYLQKKELFALEEGGKTLNKWIEDTTNETLNTIGYINVKCNDFQHNNRVVIGSEKVLSNGDIHRTIIPANVINYCTYFSVRLCMEANWLNDRDQFLYPEDGWQKDTEFQADCLTYTLFHGQNRISAADGVNHWIPFTETEVEPRNGFASHFMTDFIKEKQLTFSAEAQTVFNAGRELWCYYHKQPDSNPNAAFYDIRAYFQGRDKNGRMNKDSTDAEYMRLITELRQSQKNLAAKISKKVYLYGFLK